MLHVANLYYCTGINAAKYIQGCLGTYCIITATLFLVMLYNTCFTYQEDKTTNLLISALDRFNLGTTVDDDTFMITISKTTKFALFSKPEFHAKQFCFHITHFFTHHAFLYSWTIVVHS
jgi:hypothetical protein